MLIAPSWGGMLNGLLTLRGAWDKVRQDPVLKFMVAAVTAYGMATLEGPALAIKRSTPSRTIRTGPSRTSHRRARVEWTLDIQRPLLALSAPLQHQALVHETGYLPLRIALLGMMFYVIPMYMSGITAGMMWKQFTKDGVPAISKLPGNGPTDHPVLPPEGRGRDALYLRRLAYGLQPLEDRQGRKIRRPEGGFEAVFFSFAAGRPRRPGLQPAAGSNRNPFS